MHKSILPITLKCDIQHLDLNKYIYPYHKKYTPRIN